MSVTEKPAEAGAPALKRRMGVDVGRQAHSCRVLVHCQLVQGRHAWHGPHSFHHPSSDRWHGLDGLAHVHVPRLRTPRKRLSRDTYLRGNLGMKDLCT